MFLLSNKALLLFLFGEKKRKERKNFCVNCRSERKKKHVKIEHTVCVKNPNGRKRRSSCV
jgi:hypothetical protein|tara:strand:+ start:3347 stop:3526 length:180 start_codon:yes stop_codon:yes gene_type:complete